nr:MAG TPA: hypothetical protein [Microviridae sp.]
MNFLATSYKPRLTDKNYIDFPNFCIHNIFEKNIKFLCFLADSRTV